MNFFVQKKELRNGTRCNLVLDISNERLTFEGFLRYQQGEDGSGLTSFPGNSSVTSMNLPNKLTVARLILTVAFVGLFYVPSENRVSIAMLVFAFASFTDWWDGHLARSRNLVTNFGKLMDPVADKVLMCAALVLLSSEAQSIPGWIVVAVLAREFFVTGIRLIAMSQGAILAAEKLGKHKTTWQMIAVCYYLLHMAASEPMFAWVKPCFDWVPFSPTYFGNFSLAMMAGLTIVSGFSYFWKNRQLFDDA